MSVLISMKVKGDTEVFRTAVADRGPEFAEFSERAKGAGAIHHRFGIGDGYVLVVDEWESAEQFEKYFADPALQSFIAEIGGDTSAEPDMTITEAIASADEF